MAAGVRGACKICESQYANAINRMIEAGKGHTQIERALVEVAPEFSWSRPTFADHKKHITHPIITAQQAALAAPLIVPKTNRGALEAIRDIGIAKIIKAPDLISPDHTLKALSILEGSKKPIENLFIILAKRMADPALYRDDIIEGEYTDVSEGGNQNS